MNAIIVYKNDIRCMAIELKRGTLISFELDLIGNPRNQIDSSFTRTDDDGHHGWSIGNLYIGDKVSLVVSDSDLIDEPTAHFTTADLFEIHKRTVRCPSLKPEKRELASQLIGEMTILINSTIICRSQLKTNNVFSFGFVWEGRRKGHSRIHIGCDESAMPNKLPRIRFGDILQFQSSLC